MTHFTCVHVKHVEDSPEEWSPGGLVKVIGPDRFARYWEVVSADEKRFCAVLLGENAQIIVSGVWPLLWAHSIAPDERGESQLGRELC
ncbi:hypothetical protein [Mesorhizobium sp. WSM2239]|uniref:Uncharacterized protein n=2 Tax=unclassified Mesorhizobium TaxID=325217 RepID=A0AAU8D4N2_9HYPH